jgi:hypothetical protein
MTLNVQNAGSKWSSGRREKEGTLAENSGAARSFQNAEELDKFNQFGDIRSKLDSSRSFARRSQMANNF